MNYAELAERIRELAKKKGRIIVGIDGCGGAGKSVLAAKLAGEIEGSAIVQGDDFYLPSKSRGRGLNAVGADYDWERLTKLVLMPFKRGVGFKYQAYDWKTDRLGEMKTLAAAGRVLLVEGVYTTRRELRSMYDLKVWVECPPEVRLARGVERDGEAMRATWEKEWMPEEQRYMQHHRPAEQADVIVSGTEGTETL